MFPAPRPPAHGFTVTRTPSSKNTCSSKNSWHSSRFDVTDPTNQDQWGTSDPMNESVADQAFNAPDPRFVAPPV
ncbi:hypothetical protein [Streptosporangium sp. NPDC051022]|uniref:hypothetical protein n=1 Tax=Streptosporangium sp. NPDC051022 TaxID=3155752 RepID=UPI003413E11D